MATTHIYARIGWKELLTVWWPLLAGLLTLYTPTFYDLFQGLWSSESYAHGPIILALSLWLIVRQWSTMMKVSDAKSSTAVGWVIVAFGLLLYIIGRSQSIIIFEVGSFVVQLTAVLLIHRGVRALKVQWFPLLFMLFMVPLPSMIVDALTLPMKVAVSYVTEHFLFWLDYPIARSGVILQIGHYQLMVADACAGLQTLLTLEALGLFYLNIVRHTSLFRNVSLAALIIPISFTANVVRVTSLTLITYYFGDAAGQGFLHGFAGMVLFITALILIICIDKFLQSAESLHRKYRAKESFL